MALSLPTIGQVNWGDEIIDSLTSLDARVLLGVGDYGAVGDGTANDRAALVALDAAALAFGAAAYFPAGRYKVSTGLTFASPVVLAYGATIEPATGTTTTLSSVVTAPDFTTVFAGAGDVVLGKPQRVCADWWGAKTATTTIQRAVDSTAQGTRIELAGKYTSGKVTITADEDAGTGDQGKALVGVGAPGVRTQDTAGNWGAEIYAASGVNDHVLAFDGVLRSNGQPSRFAFELDNVKVNGNKAQQSAGAGVFSTNVKDLYVGRLLVEDCKGDGWDGGAGPCNQILVDHIEVMACDGRGVDWGSVGDSHIGFLLVGATGSDGVQLGGAVQVDQAHTYLCTGAGMILVDRAQVSSLRTNDNANEGLRVNNATDCYVGHVDAMDNGTDTGATGPLRSGVRIGGTSVRCFIASVDARNVGGVTQQYGVRFDATLTGTPNTVGVYAGSGNVLAEVSVSTAAARGNVPRHVNGSAYAVVASTTNLAAIGDSVNTQGKSQGGWVFNTTTARWVYATNPAAADTWRFPDGTTAHTPV